MSDGSRQRFYGIGAASAATGIAPHVLRYWEREFSFFSPMRDARGRRLYRQADIEKIEKIKNALYAEGYRIRGAKKRFRSTALADGTTARDRALFFKGLLRELKEIEKWLS
jgi:DNA-binding transcriptional MerR regulator